MICSCILWQSYKSYRHSEKSFLNVGKYHEKTCVSMSNFNWFWYRWHLIVLSNSKSRVVRNRIANKDFVDKRFVQSSNPLFAILFKIPSLTFKTKKRCQTFLPICFPRYVGSKRRKRISISKLCFLHKIFNFFVFPFTKLLGPKIKQVFIFLTSLCYKV